ncbi:MAG TPA: ABC transporter permease [Pseudonocardiaceae bacterium]|jgi:ABC-type transport system involved in multi-copper enzyme maturation permease subunit|nr:ABC transporter permease [Pseudonocardiaceae bacterium]
MTTDVIAAEWAKLRTLRSTYYLLGAALLALPIGIALAMAITSSWDGASGVDRAHSASADSGAVVQPFLLFLVATLGALVITAEYGTRAIQASLVVVPRRGALLAGKAVVAGGVALVVGMAVAIGLTVAVRAVVGDRPAPINPWSSATQAFASAFATGLLAMVVALIALGLGAVLRSSAGTLVTMGALVFVLPVVTEFLPARWAAGISPLCLPNLPGILAGTTTDTWLSPAGAAAVLVAYPVLALGAGALAIGRRDA